MKFFGYFEYKVTDIIPNSNTVFIYFENSYVFPSLRSSIILTNICFLIIVFTTFTCSALPIEHQ